MMTLEEAIKHCEDVALSCTNKECALEHFQLLKWLQEYSNMLEKQGKQKTNDIRTTWYWNVQDIKQNPIDKVEPKFKVGDYIKHNKANIICKIISVNNGSCYVENIGTNSRIELFHAEQNFHPWTIQDAKDGDVLAFDNDTIVIFKDLYNSSTFHSYCHIEKGTFSVSQDDMPDWWDSKGFHPATKEQRNLLFQKMKEAGYEWDTEKKELKKIEQKVAWSEEDEVKINRIVACLENLNFADNDILLKDINWLKSLRPQNNITDEELAQAKKDAYNDVLDKIEYHSGEPTFDDGWSAAIWYLKKRNVQSQSTWKPSDEQMKALLSKLPLIKGSGDKIQDILELLYQDLKKLREE